ncbi:MAG: hypothetical protein JW942_07120 [Opitutales bacterium]|nr:hypothetical protein [Opitutales bacterium]
MRIKLPCICLGSIFAASALNAAPKYLETVLPADTFAIISAKDLAESKEKLEKSSLKKLTENEQIKEFFKPIYDKLNEQIDTEDGDSIISYDEIKDYLDGQIVIGLNLKPISDALNQTGNIDGKLPGAYFIADADKAEELIEKLLEQIQHEIDAEPEGMTFELDEEDFMGVTIHHVTITNTPSDYDSASDSEWNSPSVANNTASLRNQQYDDDYEEEYDDYEDYEDYDDYEESSEPVVTHIYFAEHENAFVLSNDSEGLKTIIEGLEDSATSNFGDSKNWSKLEVTAEKSDFYAFVDADPLMNLANTAIRMSIPPADPSNPMGANADMMINALGLNSFHGMTISVEILEEGIHTNSFIGIDTNYGIGRLFSCIGDTYAKPDFVPADPSSVSTANMNVGIFIKELRQLIFNAYPQSSFIYQMYTAQIQQQGVNLDTDLIDNLDSYLVYFAMGKEMVAGQAPQTVFAFKVKNDATFKRAIDAIIIATGISERVQRRDYMGTEIVEFPSASPSQPGMIIAIKDGWLMLSTNLGTLQSAISSNNSGKSFWNSEKFDAVENVMHGSEGYAIGYTDFNMLMKAFFTGFAQGFNTQSGDDTLDASFIDDLEDMNIIFAGKDTKTQDGFISDSYLTIID